VRGAGTFRDILDVVIATAVDDDNSVVGEVFTKTCRLKSTSSNYNIGTSDDHDDDYYDDNCGWQPVKINVTLLYS